MILCAGLGTRMRPLTNNTPKPLLKVGGKPLIVWHIEKLAKAGFKEIIINIAYLGYKIRDYLGDGSRYGVDIFYSDEQEEGALETAGGIVKALPLLGDSLFLVINGDIWCDYPYNSLFNLENNLAHLILVPNPPQHPNGDFGLQEGMVVRRKENCYTFSGIGYYNPLLFKSLSYGKQPLAPLLIESMGRGEVGGEVYLGEWRDIGTPKRLEELDRELTVF